MTDDNTFDAVVLCNGDFPSHPTPLGVLRSATFLCCCDGAAAPCLEHGHTPDAIVGDGDSLPEALRLEFADRVHIVSEQEYNDLIKATRFCMARGARRIAYLGATGRREDHTLGNISLMAYCHDELHLEPLMLTDHGVFTPASGTHTFRSFPRQQVSIFNISCHELSSEGLRWQSYPYSQLWQGTLNEATGNGFTLHGDGSYIVFQTYVAKQARP